MAAFTYDYRDYSNHPSVSQKVLNRSGITSCGSTETWNFQRNPEGNATRVIATRNRTDDGQPCQVKVFDFLATNTAYLLNSKQNYDALGQVVLSTDTLDEPAPILVSDMIMRTSTGHGTVVESADDFGIFGRTSYVEKVTLLGIEAVSVPAGQFPQCLKIHRQRATNTFGLFERIEWRCPNVGLAKMIIGNGEIKELTTVVTNP